MGEEAGDARAALRTKARRLGVLASRPAVRVVTEDRDGALDATRGIGPVLDDLLADGR